MANVESRRVIYAALAGNSAIAVTKFAAATWTGSAAMLSEAIHSVVDTGNQLLLLHGLRRARKPADREHPFGYGMELYFWTFVVAILIFAGGAGVSIYEGVAKLRHPHAVTDAWINYAVLALAMVFEAGAWWIAYKEFDKRRGALTFIQAIRRSKDPTVFTVLFEDSAAMLGLVIALVGVFLADVFDVPMADAIASIGIGTVLALTAVALAYETKGLLIGEAASREVVEDIEAMIGRTRGILRVNEVLTMHLGPGDILVNISVDFDDSLDSEDVEQAVAELEKAIRARHAEVKRVFIEAQNWISHRQNLRKNR